MERLASPATSTSTSDQPKTTGVVSSQPLPHSASLPKRCLLATIVDGHQIIQMGVELVQVHVMSDISGIAWAEVWQGRVMGRRGIHEVAFIGRNEFLSNKKASGRLQDLADIEALGGFRSA